MEPSNHNSQLELTTYLKAANWNTEFSKTANGNSAFKQTPGIQHFHSWAQRKLSTLSPLNILLLINGLLLSLGFND